MWIVEDAELDICDVPHDDIGDAEPEMYAD
jgi:hypothetical protein